jgi:hypothetical protein
MDRLNQLTKGGFTHHHELNGPTLYDAGWRRMGMHLRGHTNILECLLIQAGGSNLGLLIRHLLEVGTPHRLPAAAPPTSGRDASAWTSSRPTSCYHS